MISEVSQETEEDSRNVPEMMMQERYSNIDKILDDAFQKGIISRKDKFKYIAYLERDCTPKQREEAIRTLPNHIEKKEAYLRKYSGKLKNAVFSGLISVDEAATFLKNYKGLSGQERKREADILNGIIKERKAEKKSYEQLINESPHFAVNKHFPDKKKARIDAYKKLNGEEKVRAYKELLKELEKMDRAVKLCEKNYHIANYYYKKGDYINAIRRIKGNKRICNWYPESNILKEYDFYAERDKVNLQYERKENRSIIELREKRDDALFIGDRTRAIEFSKKLVEATEHYRKFTISTSKSKPGKIVIIENYPRDEEYETDYIKMLDCESHETDKQIKNIHETTDKEGEALDKAIKKLGTQLVSQFGGSDDMIAKLAALEQSGGKETQETKEDEVDLDVENLENVKQFGEAGEDQQGSVVVDFSLRSENISQQRAKKIIRIKDGEKNIKATKGGKDLGSETELNREINRTLQDGIGDMLNRLRKGAPMTTEERNSIQDLQASLGREAKTGGLIKAFQKTVCKSGGHSFKLGTENIRKSKETLKDLTLNQLGKKGETPGHRREFAKLRKLRGIQRRLSLERVRKAG